MRDTDDVILKLIISIFVSFVATVTGIAIAVVTKQPLYLVIIIVIEILAWCIMGTVMITNMIVTKNQEEEKHRKTIQDIEESISEIKCDFLYYRLLVKDEKMQVEENRK